RFLAREGHSLNVTTCIGIASHPEHATDKDSLLDFADRAMYRGKKSSRNIIYMASKGLEATPAARYVHLGATAEPKPAPAEVTGCTRPGSSRASTTNRPCESAYTALATASAEELAAMAPLQPASSASFVAPGATNARTGLCTWSWRTSSSTPGTWVTSTTMTS